MHHRADWILYNRGQLLITPGNINSQMDPSAKIDHKSTAAQVRVYHWATSQPVIYKKPIISSAVEFKIMMA